MKKVLLTGANGYIGSSTVKFLLNQGYFVHAVTSKPIVEKSSDNFIYHQANLLSREETSALIRKIRPTHLLHLAWYVEHRKFWNAVENLDWVQATLHLAREFIENGGERLVAAGTCAEYDWSKSGIYLESDFISTPHTFYGTAKHSVNLNLSKLTEKFGVSYGWGRIFFPFGKKEPADKLIPSITDSLLNNRRAEILRGNLARDFMYIEDVAEAFVAFLESDVGGSVNIATGEGVLVSEVAKIIAEILGKPELLHFQHSDVPLNEPLKIVADVSRLKNEVKWRKDFNIKESLEKSVGWYKRDNAKSCAEKEFFAEK
jgi:UDP-glucuronate decarboxylase